MKNFLAALLAWNVFTMTSAITNCICNDQTVPAAYSPVCASDGRTYRNAQTVGCLNTCYNANLRIAANGACPTSQVLPNYPQIPAATLAPPYSTVAMVPILNPNAAVRCSCPNRGPYSPVCGSDGRTYASAQLLGCYNRCYNRNLSVIMQGYCPRNLCICSNSMYYSPVCGSDGKTYRNPKIIECLNICQNRNIAIVRYQPCRV